jgi:hypothetical protein
MNDPRPDSKILAPKAGSVYRHVKSGGKYKVVGVGLNATNGPQEMQTVVLYFCTKTGQIWVREINEFCDGRFEPLPLPHL